MKRKLLQKSFLSVLSMQLSKQNSPAIYLSIYLSNCVMARCVTVYYALLSLVSRRVILLRWTIRCVMLCQVVLSCVTLWKILCQGVFSCVMVRTILCQRVFSCVTVCKILCQGVLSCVTVCNILCHAVLSCVTVFSCVRVCCHVSGCVVYLSVYVFFAVCYLAVLCVILFNILLHVLYPSIRCLSVWIHSFTSNIKICVL